MEQQVKMATGARNHLYFLSNVGHVGRPNGAALGRSQVMMVACPATNTSIEQPSVCF